jgi:hypothetical protein
MDRFSTRGTSVLHQWSDERKEVAAAYRFVSNDRVGLEELIYQSSRIAEEQIRGKDLQVNLDRSSFSLKSGGTFRADWVQEVGVLEDNRTAGFYLTPALVLERHTQHCLGLGDILLHTRPQSQLSRQENSRARAERAKLPLAQKESGAWILVAAHTARQLETARRVTFVIDQGGDSYEVFDYVLRQLKQDFLIRVKTDRRASHRSKACQGRFSELLADQAWCSVRLVPIRPLNHISKSSGKRVLRQKREACLAIRFIEVTLERPGSWLNPQASIDQVLSLIEVREQAQTVPLGEEPIHWLLLTSWKVEQIQTAWAAVEAYQGRWHIEQLFRCSKKQGLNVESSQLRDPQSIMKLAIMSLKVSAQALQLTQVRDGQEFVPLESMFDNKEQELLEKLNAKLSGKTEKVRNPHQPDSLAWAAWVIARLGGWKGYASQRKPGPITMMRGVQRFYDLYFWTEVDFSP